MNNRGGQGEIYEHVGTYEQMGGGKWTKGNKLTTGVGLINSRVL